MSGDDGSSSNPPRLPAGVADERFAANLRGYREELRLTQADVSREMSEVGWSYHPQTVQRIESGNRKVSIGEAQALARILRTTTDRLTASSTLLEEQLATTRAELQRAEAQLVHAHANAERATTEAAHLAKEVARLESDLAALTAAAESPRTAEDAGSAPGRRAGQAVTIIRPQASANPRSLIAEGLRDGRAVVLDLNAVKDDAARIADFAAGLAAALDATTERVGGDSDDVLTRIILLAPADMALSARDLAHIDAAASGAISEDLGHEQFAGAAAAAAASAWRKVLSGGTGERG